MSPGAAAPVLITGGAGFIGTNLAARLLSLGHRVRVYDDLSRPGVPGNVSWLRERHPERLEILQADVRDRDAMREAVRGVCHVFHLAAQVAVTSSLQDPVHDFEVNARGTLNVLEAVRAQPAPPSVLYTSTNKVYGALGDLPLVRVDERWVPADPAVRDRGIDEHRALEFHSPYGCSKGAAEQYVLDHARCFGLNTVVLRMSCIYGPHQRGNEDQGWVAHFLLAARAGQPLVLYGDGCQVRDLLFVEDLVDAFLLAMRDARRLAGQAFNMGGGPANAISLLELLGLLRTQCGLDARVRCGEWRRGDQRWYVSDCARFTAATGWTARTSVARGLARLAAWAEEAIPGPAADAGSVRAPAPARIGAGAA